MNTVFSLVDRAILRFDRTLRLLSNPSPASRPYPASHLSESYLTDAEKKQAAGLMRVNHAGEMAAQGLYDGQAATAKHPEVKTKMQLCAKEEMDHINWCKQRITELSSRTSYLDPFWYTGSFLIGAFVGLIGDRWSLGFIEETEHQVMRHLESHRQQLAPHDTKTAAVIDQIYLDEAHHAQAAHDLGAKHLPKPIQLLMHWTSKIMTKSAYYW